jgi:hypothetical protein
MSHRDINVWRRNLNSDQETGGSIQKPVKEKLINDGVR